MKTKIFVASLQPYLKYDKPRVELPVNGHPSFPIPPSAPTLEWSVVLPATDPNSSYLRIARR